MVISYFLCNFNVLEINILQSTIAMITEDKVTKILCISDNPCKFFYAMITIYIFKSKKKCKYHHTTNTLKDYIILLQPL